MAYRIVICVDIHAETLKEAYGKLYDSMKQPEGSDLDWESTDEWFDDEDGALGTPEELQEARMAVYKDRNPAEF